jgi:hypothetical protein
MLVPTLRRLVLIGFLTALAPALAAGWLTYQSRTLGFSLAHPRSWNVASSKSAVVFKSPESEGEFSVRAIKAMPLTAWVAARRKEETLPDGSSRVESSSEVRLAGRPAKRIVLFGFDRNVTEEAVSANGKLYVLQYDSENPNDPKFAQHKAVYAQMRASFKPL